MDLVSLEDLRKMGVTYSAKHLNRLADASQFPRPIKLGPGRNSRKAWLKTDIEAWLQQRIDARDGASE